MDNYITLDARTKGDKYLIDLVLDSDATYRIFRDSCGNVSAINVIIY